MNIRHSSRDDRWFTPLWVIAKVREVLGDIDFDPASEHDANSRVRAREYLTHGALSRPWMPEKGDKTIFCNPPGGQDGQPVEHCAFLGEVAQTAVLSCYFHVLFCRGIANHTRAGVCCNWRLYMLYPV